MHDFIIRGTDNIIIMYCRKCGLSFQAMIFNGNAFWNAMPLPSPDDDSPMPTCTDVRERTPDDAN